MTFTKGSLIAVLGISCAFIVGCGDEQDKRLSNADVACLKMIQAGGTCAGAAGGSAVGTSTVTATSTVTVTNTTVVP